MKYEFLRAKKKANIEGAKLLMGSNSIYVEEKFDGSRYGFEKDDNGIWHAWSRNGIDRATNIPYIIEELESLNLLNGTIIDAEVIVLDTDRTKRWELSRSVMGTNQYTADIPKAHLLAFDIQMLGGEDLKPRSWLERRKIIRGIFNDCNLVADTYMHRSHLAYTRAFGAQYISDLWEQIVNQGNGEGLMLKSTKSNDWTKVKKEATADAFILGATPGKGKYEGQIGALELAVYNGDTIWPIGKCSGMEDLVRLEMTDMALAGTLKNKVIEVKFNDVTKNKKLRHPRFIRWRNDKKPDQCLLEQLDG